MKLPTASLASFTRMLRQGAGVPDPTRDWLFLLALAGIALAGIVLSNLLLFESITSARAPAAAATSTAPLVDRATLDAAQQLFAARAAERQKFANGAYSFTDPSQ